MKDISLYEKASLTDDKFPVRVFLNELENCGSAIHNHWHEQIEILYFVSGKAIVECNSIPFTAEAGQIIVINSNELHSAVCLENKLSYYCIIIDTSILKSCYLDSCNVKYITPIEQNLIIFKNNILNDTAVLESLKNIFLEYENKEIGYELAIKSLIYRLLVILLRNYIEKILTQEEYESKVHSLKKLDKIINYIENNYREEIGLENLSKIAGLSSFHLCHLFKKATGKTLTEYINQIRISRAEELLKNTNMNITEIAIASGFNDINYFSRLFKKLKKSSPSQFRKLL